MRNYVEDAQALIEMGAKQIDSTTVAHLLAHLFRVRVLLETWEQSLETEKPAANGLGTTGLLIRHAERKEICALLRGALTSPV